LSETLEPALPDLLDAQAERLMRKICDRGLKIATAESCTGGMFAALMTDIEGCGHGFDRGFGDSVVLLEKSVVDPEKIVLRLVRISDEAAVRAMAEGALHRSEADIAIGVTGFAGPGGPGQEEGLVHFALARRDCPTIHREEHFGAAGRGPVRVKSLKVMLEMLEHALEQE
jgi:nicotinamide-nucleotide amidase